MVEPPALRTPQVYSPYEAGPFRLRMGLSGLDLTDWIEVDENMPTELAEKRRLLAERHDDVFAALPIARDAACEVLDLLAAHLPETYPDAYLRRGSHLTNVTTRETWDLADSDLHPLELAGRLVQEDLCLLGRQSGSSDYVLTAACLCFPTRWRLSEKIGRSLDAVHAPVPGYDARLASSVNGLFDRIRVDRPVARKNWSILDDPTLYQPTGHGRLAYASDVTPESAGQTLWLRVERQTLRRLPVTRDVLFTIRVYVRPLSALTANPEEAGRLASALEGMGEEMRAYKSLPPIIGAAIEWLRRIESASTT